MGEVILFMEDLKSASAEVIKSSCRICHEEEFESCKSLEAPCACSGTVKFAHRDCIQRWCNEKGNTVCEICLQKFEPGYTAPVKMSLSVDSDVILRGSLEDPTSPESSAIAGEPLLESDYPECLPEEDYRRFARCRAMALICAVLLLLKDMLAVATGGIDDYPFTLTTVIIIRAAGIVLPMLVLIKIITAIQDGIVRQHRVYEDEDAQYRV